MHRVTITLDDELMASLDRLIAARGYQNRSEAIRDLARSGLQQAAADSGTSQDCIGALVYVYDHPARELAKRLTRTFHDHHDMSIATLHVHLDHDSCMEINVLKGGAGKVRHFAEHVIAERGVRHGRLVLVPVQREDAKHAHGEGRPEMHEHVHVRSGG
ncbi:MAG TPA: nickel-responsive transcriptional regulator NikR [Hyphomicrobiaceae bacterium]|nr:nickel-responsive transcriptional regulator NikR [Hyphomicrobiaceae bacterium]